AALAEALQRRSAAMGPSEASFAYEGGRWLLTLRKSGTVLLVRSWGLPATDCALLADTAALVMDRYFSELRAPSWAPRPRRIAALAMGAVAGPRPAELPQSISALPPPPPPEAGPERSVLIPAMPAVMARAEPPQPGSGMVISAGIAALDDLRPGLWLQAERRWSSGAASFLIVAGSADRDSGPAPESSLQSALMALSVGPCFSSLLRACFAPLLGVRGRLAADRRALRATNELKLVPELGAVISVERTLPYRLNAGVSLLLGRTLGEADFDPDAPPQEMDYALALRVGYQF
ncbi:MAG TPA: hypothetical protein VLW85_21265, partial [Myxococcales bacterium]|nr:hypothetical protein [Myxococcales bacterium]